MTTDKPKATNEEILLDLFDETHDAIHMLRHMSGDFLEKAEFLETTLARAVRLGLVDLSKMSGVESIPDNVIEFPNAFLRELDEE
tara:strand:+ start:697 stop:951 length:255 start_codon:yes stop_codon:yes gene_type:complete